MESADESPPLNRLPEAARSLASGTSLEAVARWFDVPESELLQLIGEADGDSTGGGNSPAGPADDILMSRVTAPASDPDESPRPRQRPLPRPTPPAPHVSTTSGGTTRRLSHPAPIGLRDSMRLLQRRLPLIVVALALGAGAGWFSAPGATRAVTTFRATHTLLYDGGVGSYNIEQVALLATSGDVPSRVAARLKMDRKQVRSAVTATAMADVATISITGRASTAETAVSLADVTAEELAASIGGEARSAYQGELDRLKAEVQTARDQLNAVPPKNTGAQAAAQASLTTAERALEQYQQTEPPKAQLRTLEAASPTAVAPSGVQAPNSKPVRAILLGALGLVAGLAAAFALNRTDPRIRSKAVAEDAFGVPVVAEVPRIPKGLQNRLLAVSEPSSAVVEAYRGLRTYVALWAPEGEPEDGRRVLVVTSPSPGEGKTTTVAHLAAMLAEIGRSVVVVSADLRRPRLHQYFDVSADGGIVEALAAKQGAPDFTGIDKPTSVRGVRLVPSGPPMENPAPLFEHAADLVWTVRQLADFVLIDAPPLLVANDAVEMARYADGVLLVARAGQTPVEAADRAAEILARLEIPVAGAVLVASEAASSASRHYASRYYAEPERAGWLRRRPRSTEPADPAPETAA